jgi:hypothetical protein
MKVRDFFIWATAEWKTEMKLMRAKGKEYTVSSINGNEDKLKNFKSIGERLGLSASMVCMVYLLKHIDSIRNYVLEGKEFSNEPIEGRIHDARNYFLLLGAIIKEEKDLRLEHNKSIDLDEVEKLL